MSNEDVLYGIIGLLAGSLLTVLLVRSAVNNNMTDMMQIMGIRGQEQMMDQMHTENGGKMSMTEMSESLKDKSGDKFDQSFITLMIDHHQGAIDMANIAKQNAKHEEIKNLANDIISAQTREIELMNQWKANWGY